MWEQKRTLDIEQKKTVKRLMRISVVRLTVFFYCRRNFREARVVGAEPYSADSAAGAS